MLPEVSRMISTDTSLARAGRPGEPSGAGGLTTVSVAGLDGGAGLLEATHERLYWAGRRSQVAIRSKARSPFACHAP